MCAAPLLPYGWKGLGVAGGVDCCAIRGQDLMEIKMGAEDGVFPGVGWADGCLGTFRRAFWTKS